MSISLNITEKTPPSPSPSGGTVMTWRSPVILAASFTLLSADEAVEGLLGIPGGKLQTSLCQISLKTFLVILHFPSSASAIPTPVPLTSKIKREVLLLESERSVSCLERFHFLASRKFSHQICLP